MTLSEINTKVTALTGASTVQYPTAQRVIDYNIWHKNIVGMILDSQDETDYDDPNWGDFPRKVTPLTVNRDYGINATERMLKIKDMTIFYDGVTGYRATPLEYSATEYPDAPASATTQNTSIDNQYSRTSPRYDVKFNSVFIYPRATAQDVSNGGYIFMEWFRQPKEITSSDWTTGTKEPGFDDNFHIMVVFGMASEYLVGKDMKRYKNVVDKLNEYETRLRRQYSSKQLDRKASLSGDYQSYK